MDTLSQSNVLVKSMMEERMLRVREKRQSLAKRKRFGGACQLRVGCHG